MGMNSPKKPRADSRNFNNLNVKQVPVAEARRKTVVSKQQQVNQVKKCVGFG